MFGNCFGCRSISIVVCWCLMIDIVGAGYEWCLYLVMATDGDRMIAIIILFDDVDLNIVSCKLYL